MKLCFRLMASVLLIICLTAVVIPSFSEAEDSAVRLLCLNIGKADCLLLMWRDAAYLIDAGYAHTYAALETALSQYGVDHLNGVFLTHCHKDHAGGLLPLAQSGIAVDAWYAARIYQDLDGGTHPAQLAAGQRGASVIWLDAGDVISLPDGASFTVLGPLTVNTENENNKSLVMRFHSSEGSILFAGDMKEDEEYELLESGLLSPCDVLKVGHHGDNRATSWPLLLAVQPKAAIICTDSREEPDTPAASTLKRISGAGAQVYVTQQATDAYLLTLKKHTVTVEDIAWQGVPARIGGLSLSIRFSDDTVTVTNGSSEDICLDGCLLYSTRGNETLMLDGLTVAAHASLVIGTKTTKDDVNVNVKWDEKKVWHQKKRDAALLYDRYGRILACTDNGLEE